MESRRDGNGSATERPPPPLVFRMNENGTGSETVRTILLDRGWREFIEGEHEEYEWNLWWRNARYRQSDYDDLMPWQRLNHFPKTTAITKKDMLARNMRRMKGVYGASVYNFTPLSFNLPNDYTKFVAEYTKIKEQSRKEENSRRQLWICKPADLSRGRGIFLFEDLSELTYDCSAVVQRYLTDPYLIAGYKFDLRLYVLVTSFHPLTVYMHQEGLARFSTDKFDLSSAGNLYSHLTNTSINKYSPNFSADKERIGQGSKWSLTMLRNYFHQQNVDDDILWQRISNIVILTLLSQVTSVSKVSGAFELFGFDVIIDSNLKPWLLEVNFNPSLSDDCAVDTTVKRSMLNHVIDILGFKEGDGHRGGEQYAKLKAKQYNSRHRRTPFVPRALPQTYRSKVVAKTVPGNSTRPVGTRQSDRDISKKPDSNRETSLKDDTRASDSKTSLDTEDEYDQAIAFLCKDASVSATPTLTTQTGSGADGEKLQTKSVSLSKLSSRESSLERFKERNGKYSSINGISSPSISWKRALASKGELSNKREEGIRQSTSLNPLTRVSSELTRADSHNSLGSCKSEDSHLSRTKSSIMCSKIPPSSAPSSNQIGRPLNKNGRNGKNGSTLSSKGDRGYSGADGSSRASPVRSTLYSKPLSHKMLAESRGNLHRNKGHTWPAARVGDFVLLFPFNDVTRRASHPAIDIRAVVKETQKELKRVICRCKAAKKGSTGGPQKGGLQRASKADGGFDRCKDAVPHWAPLKSTTLTAVEA